MVALIKGSSTPYDLGRVGKMGRVVDILGAAVGEIEGIFDRGDGKDQRDIELPFQPFLDHLQVQQAEKSAAETEAESDRGVLLEGEGGVVELQFFEGGGQVLVFVGVDRIDRGEHHLLHLLEAGQRPWRQGLSLQGDGVARSGVPDGLDAGEDIADLAGGKLLLAPPGGV